MKDKIKQILREDTNSIKSIEIQAPHDLKIKTNYTTIFLAGSIEMGKAEEWQKKIVDSVPDKPYIFFNPRRDDWDSTWAQEKSDENFREQVEWELKALEAADFIVIYFDPETESPITLVELGVHIRDPKLYVICPEGFWKKGNVDITCEFYKTKQVKSLDAFIEMLKNDSLKK
jgi:hypothetical protein